MRMALRRGGRRAGAGRDSPAKAARFPRWPRSMLRRAGSNGRPATFRLHGDRRAGRPALARSRPLAVAPSARGRAAAHDGAADAYAFLEAKGPGLHQIPVGPVHAGIIEPGHFRFHAGGEAVVRLEERLGYMHKGVDALMRGASLERAAVLAARVSGDFDRRLRHRFRPRRRGGARRRGAAAGAGATRRHGGARAARQPFRRHRRDLQRRRLRADARPLRRPARADAARGEDRLRPSADDGRGRPRRLSPSTSRLKEPRRSARRSAESRATFPKLVQLYDNTASLQDRTVGTGVLKADLARLFGAGGVSAAPRAATSMRAATIPIRLTTISVSRFRPGTRATSTPASGSGSTRSARASI